jgi:hypothetical protein
MTVNSTPLIRHDDQGAERSLASGPEAPASAPAGVGKLLSEASLTPLKLLSEASSTPLKLKALMAMEMMQEEGRHVRARSTEALDEVKVPYLRRRAVYGRVDATAEDAKAPIAKRKGKRACVERFEQAAAASGLHARSRPGRDSSVEAAAGLEGGGKRCRCGCASKQTSGRRLKPLDVDQEKADYFDMEEEFEVEDIVNVRVKVGFGIQRFSNSFAVWTV